MRADENIIFDGKFRSRHLARTADTTHITETAGEAGATQEDINERALTVFNRVQRKLNGQSNDITQNSY
jgi:hypothetical protein